MYPFFNSKKFYLSRNIVQDSNHQGLKHLSEMYFVDIYIPYLLLFIVAIIYAQVAATTANDGSRSTKTTVYYTSKVKQNNEVSGGVLEFHDDSDLNDIDEDEIDFDSDSQIHNLSPTKITNNDSDLKSSTFLSPPKLSEPTAPTTPLPQSSSSFSSSKNPSVSCQTDSLPSLFPSPPSLPHDFGEPIFTDYNVGGHLGSISALLPGTISKNCPGLKAQFSLRQLGRCITAKIESLQSSMLYIYFGMFSGLLLSSLPVLHRVFLHASLSSAFFGDSFLLRFVVCISLFNTVCI
eukprot:Sdes_comp8886_c1_seq1m280